MAISLSALVGLPSLGLTVLTGHQNLDRRVFSVAVSDLPDPTRYLLGGEFVLTTGTWLAEARNDPYDYVARLVAADAVGLGFGTAVVADSTPAALIEAAERCRLVLVEVPEQTPFIAVVRAMSDLLVEEQRAELLHIQRAHQDLSAAARRDGPGGVIRTLSTQLAGEVLLLDGTGRIREWSTESATTVATMVESEVRQLRAGGSTLATVLIDGRRVTVQALGTGPAPRGFLVTSVEAATTTLQRDLIAGAGSILSYGLDQESPNAQRRERQAALIRLVKTGSLPEPTELAALAAGLLHGEAIQVLAASGPLPQRQAWCARLQDLGEERAIAGLLGEQAYAVLSSPADAQIALASAGPGQCIGVSRPTKVEDLRRAFDDADQSCLVAAARGARAVSYADLTGGVLTIADPRTARSFAQEFLAPIDEYERTSGIDMRTSLQTWLDHHGHYEPAATSLGLHRHTLRSRIRRAQTLLGRDLDDAASRVDLWFALQVGRVDTAR